MRISWGNIALLVGTIIAFGTVVAVGVHTVRTYIETERVAALFEHDPYRIGNHYFDAGVGGEYDLAKARHYYEQAIDASSTANERVWYQLGRIDFLEGNFDAAVDRFQTQIELFDDTEPRAYYMLGLTHAYNALWHEVPGEWERAEAAFRTYLEHDAYNPWARVDLAWIYFSQGEYTEMLPLLETGLEYHPENAWLHNMYGLALLNTGSVDAARQHFERARKLAAALTPQQWGVVYPGNDPDSWSAGLASFQDAIEKNLELVADSGRVR